MAHPSLGFDVDSEAANREFEVAQAFERNCLWTDALEAYARSRQLGNDDLAIHQSLAKLYSGLGYCGRARWYASRAAELSHFSAPSLLFLARTQYRTGELQACLRSYRQAMDQAPDDAELHSSYLFTLIHDEHQTPLSLKKANELWMERHGRKGVRANRFNNNISPIRPLRIGYISAEYWESMGRHFLLPVFRQHDHSKFQLYCYHAADVTDATTEEFRRHADHWRVIHGQSADEIRQTILRDEIDILVERSSHIAPWQSGPVLLQGAAPVQIAYLDYPCTTGCFNIDYFITDRWTTPDEKSAQQFSERNVYRVPSGSLLFEPFADTPNVKPLPALDQGTVTFGLLQRPVKYHEGLWDAVARILRSIPGSRLLIQHGDNELEEPAGEVRSRFLAGLNRRGVSTERVRFIGTRSQRNHLLLLSTVDIALDTFPYSGATTTCFCLWMGVPVVTLPSEIYASRVSSAILSRLGMEDWVANSLDDYVRIATEKASNIEQLAELRAGLRERMAKSTICRPETVVRELEEGYRWMWQKWCAKQTSEANVSALAARP